jgi:hypothetical protein
MPAAHDRTEPELVEEASRRGIEIVDGIDDVIDADVSSSPNGPRVGRSPSIRPTSRVSLGAKTTCRATP